MRNVFAALCLVLGIVVPVNVNAQKAEELQNSYNYKRALEIIDSNGDENEALGYLSKEVAEHPNNGYAYYMIGMLYSENGQPGDAIEPMDKAIALLKKDKVWITYAYRQRAKICLRLNEEDCALKNWSLSLKANPKDVDTYMERAEYYYQMDKYEESTADYKRICDLQPGNTLGYIGLGRNALEQEQYDVALKLFAYTLSLDPSNAKAYTYRAEAYLKQGNTSEAIDDIIKALRISGDSKAFYLMQTIEGMGKTTLWAKLKVQQIKNPNEEYWPYCLGALSERDSMYMKAIEHYQAANKISPNDASYYRIACCYEEIGDYDEALKNIEQAIEMDPNDDDYVSEKADLLYDMGRGKEAIAAYDQYIKANPEFFGGYYRRGFLKDNLNDVDGAIEDYSMAIALKPDYAYAYLGRADKFLLKGDTTAAHEDYRKVVALDTFCSDENCAQFALMGLGERDKAKDFEKRILEKSPSAGNYYDAACLYARMGERDSSLYFLKKSLEKGFTRFAHIRNDDDLDVIRGMEEYKRMMEEYERKYREKQQEKADAQGEKTESVCEIPFTREGGNCYVQCKINDLPMKFVFDTGASDVSISMVEATFMMKNGYLTKEDVVGSAYFSDAVGNINEGTVINLRKVQFGDMEIDNVRASVVRNQKAPLLLGQTVLSRAGKIEIDNEKKALRVRYLK